MNEALYCMFGYDIYVYWSLQALADSIRVHHRMLNRCANEIEALQEKVVPTREEQVDVERLIAVHRTHAARLRRAVRDMTRKKQELEMARSVTERAQAVADASALLESMAAWNQDVNANDMERALDKLNMVEEAITGDEPGGEGEDEEALVVRYLDRRLGHAPVSAPTELRRSERTYAFSNTT